MPTQLHSCPKSKLSAGGAVTEAGYLKLQPEVYYSLYLWDTDTFS